MSKKAFMAALILMLLSVALAEVPQSKAAPKTIVVPDDYPTIQAAIGNATNGDTVLVRSGTYVEHALVINKTISLIGENANNTIIKNIDPQVQINSSHSHFLFPIIDIPTPVTISADNVIISGFTITDISNATDIYSSGSKTLITGNNLPQGIRVDFGSYQTIAQNSAGTIVSLSPYSFIANNTVPGAGMWGGINIGASNKAADNTVVYGNIILNDNITERFGISVYGGQGVLIAGNSIVNSSFGIYLVHCGNNIIAANTVTDSFRGLSDIFSVYPQVNSGNGNNTFYANNIVNNSYATMLTGLNDILYCNNFITNSYEIGSFGSIPDEPPNPNPVTLWHNGTAGNYWGDYLTKYPNATEVDTSGTGNIEYIIDANNTDPHPLIAPYDASTVSIQLPDWVNLSLAAPLPTPSFPPLPSRSPSPVSLTSPSPSPSIAPSPSIPEFPSWIILPLALTTVIIATAITRKRSQTKSTFNSSSVDTKVEACL